MKTSILIRPMFFLFIVALFPGTSYAIDYHVNCNQCHVPHSDVVGTYQFPLMNAETGCMSCHDGSVAEAPEANIHEDATCIDCHDGHSNQVNYYSNESEILKNISLVGFNRSPDGQIAQIMNMYDNYGVYYNVAFDSSREFWRTDRDEDGGRRVCQVCHDVPTFGNHPTRTDCTASCHQHANGFLKVGGGGS